MGRRSVTPADEGCQQVMIERLAALGFQIEPLRYGNVENFWARHGNGGPVFCFAGHTDVVPVGDAAGWRTGPFEARIEDGRLYGRGACDMKSAIAAFVSAAGEAVAAGEARGSLSLLITGDEEGPATDGTKAVVAALAAEGERIDHCLVGEPTSVAAVGDMIKIGRRGSVNAHITVEGVQGHVAYPHKAANPVPVLIRLLAALQDRRLDDGYPQFQSSNLEVTTIDVGNPTSNVIPARATARLNIRFNPAHTGQSLGDWIKAEAARAGEDFAGRVDARIEISGEAFLTEPGPFVEAAAAAVADETGRATELSTTGGTSDARFIRSLCPVLELGLVGTSMHAVDEHAAVEDIRQLTRVYRRLIVRYFETFGG